MSDPNANAANRVVPIRADQNPDGLSAKHTAAAASPITRQPPMSISYSFNATKGSQLPALATQTPIAPTPQTVPANDPRIDAFKKIIGGMLYLERYDALEKLLSDETMNTLRNFPMEDSKQSALAHLLNLDFYIHPGQTLSATGSTPNTRNAFLINELCSKLTDAPNETADKMQTHIRSIICALLNMDEIDCSKEQRHRKERKPFYYIATSGNLEFVELFITTHPNLIPEIHSEEGQKIVAVLKSGYLAPKPSALKAEATTRVNDIVTMISEATTQRDLKNGDFHRISPEQYIASLMGETPVAVSAKSLPAPKTETAQALPAPKRGRKPKPNNGLEPK